MLDGDVAAFFSSAFGSFYLDALLYPPASFSDDGTGGGDDSPFGTAIPVKAQVDVATDAMRRSEGYVDTDVRILVLAHGLDPITTDYEVAVRGKRWSIANVGRDPAIAYYDLHGRLSGDAED